MLVYVDKLRDLIERVVVSEGNYSRDEARKIGEVFLFAEMTGKNTQGVLKLMATEAPQSLKRMSDITVEEKSKVSALVDGKGATGPLAAYLGMENVIAIAKENGIGVVGIHNTFSSIGALSFYARKMAQNDLIGIVMANSPRSVAHYGSKQPTYGTNPIAYGFPTETYPITFDAASAAITWYGLVRADMLGEELPDDVAINANGEVTKDPREAMMGAILPFDRSHKGSGLAMVVELLAGPLVGASYIYDDGDWGTFMLAFSPALLTDVKDFKRHASRFIEKVRTCEVIPGQEIKIPGFDKEERIESLLRGEEKLEIEDVIYEKLVGLAEGS